VLQRINSFLFYACIQLVYFALIFLYCTIGIHLIFKLMMQFDAMLIKLIVIKSYFFLFGLLIGMKRFAASYSIYTNVIKINKKQLRKAIAVFTSYFVAIIGLIVSKLLYHYDSIQIFSTITAIYAGYAFSVSFGFATSTLAKGMKATS